MCLFGCTARCLIAVVMVSVLVPITVAQVAPSPSRNSKAAVEQDEWPVLAKEHKPGVIWWVPASAMDRSNITFNLEQLSQAGFGGMSMVPIYGVKGQESRFLDYLSPEWIAMFEFTSQEAKRLGLWLDLTPGTGWKIGGANVTEDMGEQNVKLENDQLVPYRSRAKVKRAAPGGAGLSIDPYSVASLRRFLENFDQKLATATDDRPRAFYHDSFEYNGNWTPSLLETFKHQHGYELTDYAQELFGRGDNETAARVQRDYRQTLSGLHFDFVTALKDWSSGHGSMLREQAHGSPGNILDLYAIADIPETEVFGANRFDIPGFRREEEFSREEDDASPLVNRMASSAAHISGGKLVSSESFTWLREHFNAALSNIKPEVDSLLLTGVNHLFYHGNCYSPKDAPWPGWLFYASTEMNPRNAIWRDVPTLNRYISRCQSILQSGQSDNDVLLYWPIDDVLSSVGERPEYFLRVHNHKEWITETPCGHLAEQLTSEGFAYDFISDRHLQSARAVDGAIVCGNSRYQVLVIPPTTVMTVATLRKIHELMHAGAKVEFASGLPQDVPGLGNLEQRRQEFNLLCKEMQTSFDSDASPATKDMRERLIEAGAIAEPMASVGLKSIRRLVDGQHYYFIVNDTAKDFDGRLVLGHRGKSAMVMDPMTGETGNASIHFGATEGTGIDLQLLAGQSIFVRLQEVEPKLPAWKLWEAAGESVTLTGAWELEFIEGGPELPKPATIERLGSWTELADQEAERFAGSVRYRHEFTRPAGSADAWQLDLGDVRESARVFLNGELVSTLVTNPYVCRIDALAEGNNVLEVEVTNLSANRIRDLDRRKVDWRIFYDINYVNLKYKPFDASEWPVRPAGLLGPVRLHPLQEK